jgi:predicted dehydrogenase
MVSVAICGLGHMGQKHLRVCEELGIKVLSTYDPKYKQNYSEFIDGLKSVDGLIISSPTDKHISNIRDAIDINPKIKILCEKPVSNISKDDRLTKIKNFSSSILVGQIERFNNAFITLKAIIDIQNIIQIKTVRVNNTPARENLHCRMDIGIHDLDLCCNIAGQYPKNINIMSNKNYSHENLIYSIDNIQIINEISWNYPYKDRRIQVLTNSGVYTCDLFKQNIIFTDWSNEETNILVAKVEPLRLEILEFQKMCVENKDSISTIENNLLLLELMGY